MNLQKLRGQQPQESELGKKIRAYAANMSVSGAYLDMIDAQILAYKSHCTIGVVFDSDRRELSVASVVDYWKTLMDPSVEMPIMPEEEHSVSNWVLVSCNASYDSSQQTNHWLPGWRRESMSEDVFFDLTVAERSATSVLINQENQKLMELQGLALDEADETTKLERLSAVEECQQTIDRLLGQIGPVCI